MKEGGEDIELVEFREEVGDDLFKLLVEAEIETAKEFLKADPATLLSFEGMTPTKLEELRKVMMAEFEEDELRDIDIRPVSQAAPESAVAENPAAENAAVEADKQEE